MANPKDDEQRLAALNSRVQDSRLRGAWQRDRGAATQEENRPAVWRWN